MSTRYAPSDRLSAHINPVRNGIAGAGRTALEGDMEPVETSGAPRPAGHYAQAVRNAGLVFVAGQLPLDPATGEVVGAGIEEQTERTLRNVEAILRAAGSGLEQLLAVTIYVTERSMWAGCNAAFARVLGPHRPARAVIPVPELRPGCLVEIQAVAAVGDKETA